MSTDDHGRHREDEPATVVPGQAEDITRWGTLILGPVGPLITFALMASIPHVVMGYVGVEDWLQNALHPVGYVVVYVLVLALYAAQDGVLEKAVRGGRLWEDAWRRRRLRARGSDTESGQEQRID